MMFHLTVTNYVFINGFLFVVLGMRTAMLFSTFMMAAGTALKALPVGNDLNSW